MYKYIKRIVDIILSIIGLVVFSLPFLVIIIAIKIESRGSVLFRQKRVGRHKKLFRIYKFRTMKTDTPRYIPTWELENAGEYITKVGRFLRKTSLDELPQIFNIIKGDMSIVGPRPVIKKDTVLIKERDKYGANDILPGLTGWAQINGRDKVSPFEKARLDGYYVEHMSFRLDMKCVFITMLSVLRAENIVEGREFKNPEMYNDEDD